MTPKEYVDKLTSEKGTFLSESQAQDMANLLNIVSVDIYSESERFIFELIQNADDAAQGDSNEIHFHFFPSNVVVSHNGKVFSEEDVSSITRAGASTKKSDPNKTGYKGIGFKSVFGKSDKVTILSGGYQFRFDKFHHKATLPWQMIPLWTEIGELPKEVQIHLSKFNYNVSSIIEIPNAIKLQGEIDNLLSNGQILLFLRKISKITVSKESQVLYTVSKHIVKQEDAFNEVTLSKDGKLISTWIVKLLDKIPIPQKTKEELKKDSKAPEKLREAEFTEITFAAKIENGRIRQLNPNESLIFTYLPTKVSEFGFPFLVNGSFMTNAARESLNQDAYWNHWLMELIGEKLLDWIIFLNGTLFKHQTLKILPASFNSASNVLKDAFNNSLLRNAQIKDFILTLNETFKKPSEVILDKTALSLQAFIDKLSIVEYLNQEKNEKFTVDCFVNPRIEDQGKLKEIGVKTFELENFATFFESKSFTSRHTLENNFKLIQYCKQKSDEDKKGIWFDTLKGLPFIFDDKKNLNNPETGICFPIGAKSTELGDIPVIHEVVFDDIQKDKTILDWLKSLGVKEPSREAYVSNVIIPGLKVPGFINSENYLNITRYLYRLFHENKLTEEMLAGLRELSLKIKSQNVEFKQAQDCFLSNKYRPELQIDGVINEVHLVSEEYIDTQYKELQWNLFFKAIKVKDKVEIDIINDNNSLPTLRILTAPEWVDGCKDYAEKNTRGFGFQDSNLIGGVQLPTFLNFTTGNYKYAQLFWNAVIGNNQFLAQLTQSAKYKYGIGYGKNAFQSSVENYFPWFVRNRACIPTSAENILKPIEVFINDKDIQQVAGKYLPVLEYEGVVPPDWREFLGFKTNLELEDYLDILTKIHEKAEDEESTAKPSLKRIGLIYNKIASMVPNLIEAKKAIITEWAVANKVLSVEGKFESPAELNWISIEGFATESSKLKILNIPDNCHIKTESFKSLMSLFGVNVIDKFVPTFKGSSIDFSLKARLEKILNVFATIVAKNGLDDEYMEYQRLFRIIESTEFYSATDINLSFDNNGELIEGPSEIVYRTENKFYFKNKWKSERTLLYLVKELSSMMGVNGFNGELRFLLLENDPNEITSWLSDLNVDALTIPQTIQFTKQSSSTPISENSQGDEKINNVAGQEDKPSVFHGDEPEFETPFIPKVKATDSVFKNTQPTTTKINSENVEENAQFKEMHNEKDRLEVGRWSEEFVNAKLPEWGTYSNIVWENAKGESGKPYDFKISENGIEKFIEVKGTPSSDKGLFYLSNNEYNLMVEKGENYFIIRVYDAGEPTANAVYVNNPYSQIKKGTIQVALKI